MVVYFILIENRWDYANFDESEVFYDQSEIDESLENENLSVSIRNLMFSNENLKTREYES